MMFSCLCFYAGIYGAPNCKRKPAKTTKLSIIRAVFGENQLVEGNSLIPHSSLNKRHNALPKHRVREMIAAKLLGYYWIDGKQTESRW
jgi:hypothetical protein